MSGFVCRDFAQRKGAVLDDLAHNTHDLSPKGSVDTPIQSLVSLINSTSDFYTTSSCSGRIALFQPLHPTQSKRGRWLLIEHQQVDVHSLREAIQRALVNACEEKKETGEDEGLSSASSSSSVSAVLKFEPFIVSIACRSLSCASALLQAAIQSGCRESGIAGLHLPTRTNGGDESGSALPLPVLLSVRCSIRMEVPLLDQGRLLVPDLFLEHCVQQVNDKFSRNWQVSAIPLCECIDTSLALTDPHSPPLLSCHVAVLLCG